MSGKFWEVQWNSQDEEDHQAPIVRLLLRFSFMIIWSDVFSSLIIMNILFKLLRGITLLFFILSHKFYHLQSILIMLAYYCNQKLHMRCYYKVVSIQPPPKL